MENGGNYLSAGFPLTPDPKNAKHGHAIADSSPAFSRYYRQPDHRFKPQVFPAVHPVLRYCHFLI